MANSNFSVLLILENAGAGSGRHVVDLAKGLLNNGHQVTLVYSQRRLEDWFEAALRDLTELKIKTIDMLRGPSLKDFSALLKLRRFIKDNGPFHVIHGHSSKGGAFARLAGLGTKACRVYTPHAFFTLQPELPLKKRLFYSLLETTLAKLSHSIICVSKAEYCHAQTLGIANRKLHIVTNGLAPLPPADRAHARALMGLCEQDICVGFVGRLAPQKSVHRLISAFATSAAKSPNSKLVLVGDGPLLNELTTQAQQLGVADKIVWMGQADGPALMAGFDIFALTSEYEAFPYVLLEAAARALPFVITRVGGVDEIVQHQVNGYIAEQNDQVSLTKYLSKLCDNQQQRETMGQASLQQVAAYDVETMVQRIEQVYACSDYRDKGLNH